MLEMEAVADKPEDIRLYQVTYESQGLRVKGYFGLPLQEGPFSGLMYCRGGIKQFGKVTIDRIAPLIRRGFAVMAPFYRGNEGGEGHEDFAGEDRNDVYHALLEMKKLPQISKEPISLLGFSRGAMMAMLAARDCADVKAVIVWGGVSDLLYTYEERVDLRRMLKRVVGHPMKQREAYMARSPIYWAERIHVPVLILHGEKDQQVSVKHAFRLAEALQASQREFHLKIYNGWGHRLLANEQERICDDIAMWLNRLD